MELVAYSPPWNNLKLPLYLSTYEVCKLWTMIKQELALFISEGLYLYQALFCLLTEAGKFAGRDHELNYFYSEVITWASKAVRKWLSKLFALHFLVKERKKGMNVKGRKKGRELVSQEKVICPVAYPSFLGCYWRQNGVDDKDVSAFLMVRTGSKVVLLVPLTAKP